MNLVRLRTEIDKSGVKHKVLAGRIGMHPTTFCRALKGEAKFDADQMSILITILGIKFEALMKKAS